MSDNKVIISDKTAGKNLELPVVRGTEGEPTLDIKSLAGLPCRIANPWIGWRVQISGVGEMEGETLEFQTQAGRTYSIASAGLGRSRL